MTGGPSEVSMGWCLDSWTHMMYPLVIKHGNGKWTIYRCPHVFLIFQGRWKTQTKNLLQSVFLRHVSFEEMRRVVLGGETEMGITPNCSVPNLCVGSSGIVGKVPIKWLSSMEKKSTYPMNPLLAWCLGELLGFCHGEVPVFGLPTSMFMVYHPIPVLH